MFFGIQNARADYNPRYASIVIDADTGQIISARYADKVLYPASLTKIMTLLMAFDAIERGELHLHDRIQISKHAASMVPSKLGLQPGSSIKVQDAIKIVVTKSANDIAVALAEAVAGTEEKFAYKMTQRARQIGMRNTKFRNASGLHHPGQVSTARDMAKLARYLIKDYPNYYQYFSTKSFAYRGSTYTNHNRLMNTYVGMDGLKTGYIAASGFNLVASAVRDNRRLIGVVFGGRTSQTRNAHMEALLNASFTKMRTVKLASTKPAPAPAKKPTQEIIVASLEPEAGRILLDAAKDVASLIGQGDYDPQLINRYETGLMAASALTGKPKQMVGVGVIDYQKLPSQNALYGANSLITNSISNVWAIQVGAFQSRLASDRAIQQAQLSLPDSYFNGLKPLILPSRAANNNETVFRARLSGFTEDKAKQACAILKDCLVVGPDS